jgi:hypothetical protein
MPLNDVILHQRPAITTIRQKESGQANMLRLIKWLIYLAILGFIALIAFAYLGPIFGVDFAPPTEEIRQDIILETD